MYLVSQLEEVIKEVKNMPANIVGDNAKEVVVVFNGKKYEVNKCEVGEYADEYCLLLTI